MGKKNICSSKEVQAGQKYNRWTVVNYPSIYKKSLGYCDCECECGTKRTIMKYGLVNGNSKSCGCLRDDAIQKTGQNNHKIDKCSFCGEKHYAKGFCRNCYARFLRSGTAEYQAYKIDCYDRYKNFLKTYDTAKEASADLHIPAANITACVRGTTKCTDKYFFAKHGEPLVVKATTKLTIAKVYMRDKDTFEIIKVFETVKEAAKYVNGSRQGIHYVLAGDLQTYKGYIWTCDYM